MSTRNLTIDIARGIGAVLVVLGHNWLVVNEKGELYRVIYSFHIPLFLFISGMFIKDSTSVPRFILSRIDALLKPYLVIFFSLSVFMAIFSTGNSSITVSPLVFFLRALYATPGYITWEWLPLWYVPHLFLALVISKIIIQASNGLRHRQYLVMVTAISGMIFGIWFINTSWLQNPRPPFTSDVLFISIAIILIGFLTKEKIQTLSFKLPVFISVGLIFFVLHYSFDETIDLSLRLFSHLVISTIQIILGVYFVLSASSAIKEMKILSHILAYIGSGSLFILFFHNFVQVRIYWVLLGWGFNNVVSSVVGIILGITLPLAFLELVKRQWFLSAIFLPQKSENLVTNKDNP